MRLNTDKLLVSRPSVAPQGSEALGQTHYSYGFAAHKFQRMLEQEGVRVLTIAHPEQFKTETFARSMGLNEGAYAHLMFRSTESIRPIPGAYNIAHFAWEFPYLKADASPDEPIIELQTHMLNLCDEVWVCCRYSARVLEEHGIGNIHIVPSPIEVASPGRGSKALAWEQLGHAESIHLVSFSTNFQGLPFELDREEDYVKLARTNARPLGRQPRLQTALEKGGPVVLSVLNPYDKRKNLANLIEGFLLATAGRDDAVLVIKLATSGVVELPEGYLYHQIRLLFGRPHCLDEDRVIFVGGYLSDADMTALYRGADLYLCTSIAEGQNLPLLEAMAHECVPVSVRNTAMMDYITEENAVVIAESEYKGVFSGLGGDVSGKTYPISLCDRYQIADAVGRAINLSTDKVERMRAACRATVEQGYGPDVVFQRVLARLQAIDGEITREALSGREAATPLPATA